MARRRLLSDELWARHLAPPTDEREIARHYTLGADDLAHAATKRGDANRLGYTLMLLYLRHPGRALEAGSSCCAGSMPPVAGLPCPNLPQPCLVDGLCLEGGERLPRQLYAIVLEIEAEAPRQQLVIAL